jgi:L-ascorbate metabolism protein UlaG (beta-lactamase superfamily)
MILTRRMLILSVGLTAAVGAKSFGQARPLPRASADTAVKITWVGGPTAEIVFGDFVVLTDPMLGADFAMGDPNDTTDYTTVRRHRRLTPFRRPDLSAVDVVVLSHTHEDHFDQQAWVEVGPETPIILPVADRDTVSARGFRALTPLRWGESLEFRSTAGHVSITAVAARHSRDRKIADSLGQGNGYWFEFTAGEWKRTLYWTGDTMPTEDVVEAVRARGRPDVMLAHAGGVGRTGPFGQISMGASDVIELATRIEAGIVLPIHHSTYDFYKEPISELVDRSRGSPFRLDMPGAGESVVYR